ncbi:MAG: hypothetical protein IT375_03190 [Polyangiaceae bacterium]|nr:hypothetical protein [Polyangiaceae bacterium]
MRLWSVSFCCLLALSLSGCMVDHDGHEDCVGPTCNSYIPPDDAAESTIDTGATLAEIEPGQGAGAFVEYAEGGKWRVFTSCDTAVTGYDCPWDIIVAVDEKSELIDFAAEGLEASDYVDWRTSSGVRMVAKNSMDLDGFTFETTPGATVRVDVYLDDAPAPAYIYWVGDGGLHQGSPTNPIDLTPSAP